MSAPNTLLSRLAGLDEVERTILELVAVAYQPTTRTAIARGLTALGVRIGGRAVKAAELPHTLESLAGRGLLTGDAYWSVAADLSHAIMMRLAGEGTLDARARAMQTPTRSTAWRPDFDELARDLRVDLYAKRFDAARKIHTRARGLIGTICKPCDAAWLAELPLDLRMDALEEIVEWATVRVEPCKKALAMLERLPELSDEAHRVLVERKVLEGRLEEAEELVMARASVQSQVNHAWLLALRGRFSESVTAYESALAALPKKSGGQARALPEPANIFFVIALLATGAKAARARATMICQADRAKERRGEYVHYSPYPPLLEVVAIFEGRLAVEEALFRKPYSRPEPTPLSALAMGLAAVWTGANPTDELRGAVAKQESVAREAGLGWLAGQLGDVLDKLGGGKPKRSSLVGVSLAEAVREPERWPEQLDALLAITSKPAATPAPTHDERDTRLLWVVTESYGHLELAPREQSRSKGKWSKGRPVALKRLYDKAGGMDHLTDADRAACAAIEQESHYSGRYLEVRYSLDEAKALRALAGQPNLVTEVAGVLTPVEVRERAVGLLVQRSASGDALTLVLDPAPRGEEETRLLRAGPAVVEIVAFEPKHRAIAAALGAKGLTVPLKAEPRLREVLTALSGVAPVQADLDASHADGETVPADPALHVLVRRQGEGLSVEVVVRPLGPSGPVARPGEGGASFFGALEGRRQHAVRDLDDEARRLAALLAQCPTLASAALTRAGYVLPDREAALEAVLELRAVAELEWPDGEALRVSELASVESLSVQLRGASDRFEVTGSLALPGHDPLALDTLLGYLAASPGRFLRLEGSDAFLALSDELRQRLDELRALSVPGDGLRFHPLFVSRVDALLEEARVRADAAWKRQRARLAAVGEDPDVSSTFRGELRPYQLDGFRWLARLGRMGAGACLADDMGLGKTIQTLALLVHRAPEGPSLVVAPTSVLPSYLDEITRFAPTLRPRLYAGEGRGSLLDDLGPFDVLLTSYTLLQQDIDALAPIPFAVAVLDEAQAIKNASTLRAKAAFRLTAQQRVATTGTPVENHLEELWSLFRFLNPGLLGAASQFTREPPSRIKRLLAPFVLRRTKTAVVQELPPKTEVTLRVDLLPEEAALYEVLRDEALASIASVGKAGERRMHILAALTKLRRASSNARLVLPTEGKSPSSKLEALGDLLDDLLPNRHKVLIFSQFVDHLALVREVLDERGVSYQYLDGGTPMKARKAAIDAFQAGRSDAFLISLKAGGLGLNLTAADYVVHMDPWWNPAVEDQASDRAHRIGQTRPVTVYRIVARSTIEESILELHHRKRDLAARLLEGSDAVARISEEELIELIRGA